MIFFRFVLVGLLLVASSVYANESSRPKQELVQALKVEYRLRLGAQKLMKDAYLFDDLGLLGRGIVSNVLSLDESAPSSGTGEGRLPEEPLVPLVPPSETITTVLPITQEMSASDFDPLLSLQMQIEQAEEVLAKQNVLIEKAKKETAQD